MKLPETKSSKSIIKFTRRIATELASSTDLVFTPNAIIDNNGNGRTQLLNMEKESIRTMFPNENYSFDLINEIPFVSFATDSMSVRLIDEKGNLVLQSILTSETESMILDEVNTRYQEELAYWLDKLSNDKEIEFVD